MPQCSKKHPKVTWDPIKKWEKLKLYPSECPICRLRNLLEKAEARISYLEDRLETAEYQRDTALAYMDPDDADYLEDCYF